MVLGALGACTSPSYPNRSLTAQAFNPSPLIVATEDPDDPVILMAFSGGGARAAGLSFAVLQQLHGLTYQRRNMTVSLLDRVKVVSSVSGGSVTAAYFGASTPDQFAAFSSRLLEKDNMASLEWKAANPITWLRLVLQRRTRIDVFRALIDKELFDGRTFAELNKPGKPIILLNATDMASGEVFAFTPQRFNDICSDLSQLPISIGVSASAAFPIALTPITLRNYSGESCVGAVPKDDWISDDLNHLLSRYLNLEEYKTARYANDLRHGLTAFRHIQYLHLLDGGVADNQGIHSLLDTVTSPHGPVRLLDAINNGTVKKIVVIVVNARSDAPSALDTEAGTPGIISVLKTVTGVPIDAATASLNANMQLVLDTLTQAAQDARSAPGAPKFAGLRVYGIQIDFDQFRPDQNSLRDKVKAIGTTWTLSAEQRQLVAESGQLLLRQHPCFQRLASDLNIAAAQTDPFIEQACTVAEVPPNFH